jgi:hypothetical protein
MPMEDTEDLFGTNADGTKNDDYCKYCYENGTFKADISMEEMIEFCVPHVVSANSGMTEDAARSMVREFFPKLKRWKNT